MALKPQPLFDPKSFLALVGEGRSIEEYRKDQIVFSQGGPADAVFYIQSDKVKVSIVSQFVPAQAAFRASFSRSFAPRAHRHRRARKLS